ncbi:MAG: DUF3471 domain-containing protein [Bacteroidales bacterium]|nr:DUF3471 domain-containing protein [Bacteroidales bacterium]
MTHNGGYDGMISQTVLIPEEKIAFVILTNSLSGMYYPLVYQTLDVLLGQPDKDWSQMFLEFNNHNSAKTVKETEPQTPLLPLNEYSGVYHCEMYGDAIVKLEDGYLRLHLNPTKIFEGPLKHIQYNTFEIEFSKVPSLPKGKVNFILDDNGKISQMTIDVPNPDFDFTELEFFK